MLVASTFSTGVCNIGMLYRVIQANMLNVENSLSTVLELESIEIIVRLPAETKRDTARAT